MAEQEAQATAEVEQMRHDVDPARSAVPLGHRSDAKAREHQDDGAENHDSTANLVRRHEVPAAAVAHGLRGRGGPVAIEVAEAGGDNRCEHSVIPPAPVGRNRVRSATERPF